MIFLFLSLLIPIFIGFFLISLLLGIESSSRLGLLFRLSLGTGVGAGVSSIIYFFWLVIFGSQLSGYIVFEIFILLVLIVLYTYSVRAEKYSIAKSLSNYSFGIFPRLRLILLTSFSMVLLSSLVYAFLLLQKYPHGKRDAFAIWNMRARFLFRGDDQWTNAFSTQLSHPDYPLFLPSSVARSWGFIGNDTLLVPIVISLVFMLVTAGLLYSSLSILRSRNQGLLGATLLLGTPFFVYRSLSQTADVPLGFYAAASICTLFIALKLPGRKMPLLVLAGALAGMTGWVKNEGLLFIVSLLSAFLIVSFYTKNYRAYLRDVSYFVVGLAPILSVIVYFKIYYAPSNSIISLEAFPDIISRITNLSRYPVVAKHYIQGLFNFGNSVLLVIGIYVFLVGVQRRIYANKYFATALLAVIFTGVGFFAVYVITPTEISRHFNSSFSRLLLQLWPSVILLCFLAAYTPEEYFSNE